MADHVVPRADGGQTCWTSIALLFAVVYLVIIVGSAPLTGWYAIGFAVAAAVGGAVGAALVARN
jgi:hypothetical protein